MSAPCWVYLCRFLFTSYFNIKAINPGVERWWAECCLSEMPPGRRLTAALPGTDVTILVSLSYVNSYSHFPLCLSKARRLMVQWMLLLRQRVERKQCKIHWQIHCCTHTGWKKQIDSNICRAFGQFRLQLHVIVRCSWHRIKVLVYGVRRKGEGGLKQEALYLIWIHYTQNEVWCKVLPIWLGK